MSRSLLAELLVAVDGGATVCLATVVATSRSVPRHAGSKMLIFADGRTSGTIGGGEMESRVVREAAVAVAQRSTRMLTYQLVDPASGDPGVCGGEVTITVEPYMPTPTLYVIGCGHVGKAVIELAHWMSFRVVAVDDRPELAVPSHLPEADEVFCGSVDAAIAKYPITSETHVVVVTRNMGVDVALLPHVLASPARSVGVMGSKRRWEETKSALITAGVSPIDLARVLAPIGIELNAETPEEIAVSVLAEIVALRREPLGAAGDA